ncbi:unnamed protein product [Acanthosepion pharaonis]|uniref:Uncharacterized protein n=1 Tax=Acanthosepion pharaonis TaxID=158019 RepID=A0A812EG91_ACAPH|nr:unnamed protein product [Sepia pharaonis]
MVPRKAAHFSEVESPIREVAPLVLKPLDKLLHKVRLAHLADINARIPLLLAAVKRLGLELDLAAHHGVVCITVRAVETLCFLDWFLRRSWLCTSCGKCIVQAASVRSRRPRIMTSTQSVVKVAQENKLFHAGDTADGGCYFVVKLVISVWCGTGCWGIHDEEGDRACCGAEAEHEEYLGTVAAWFYRIQQAVLHCKAYYMLAWFLRALPLSEECVVLLLQRSGASQTFFLKSSHMKALELNVHDGSFPEVADVLGDFREVGRVDRTFQQPSFRADFF